MLALVFLLENPLHVEVELPLALDALLLHVSDDALVHCLWKSVRQSLGMRGRGDGAAYGLLGALLEVDEEDGGDGEEGGAGEGQLGCARHGCWAVEDRGVGVAVLSSRC